MLDNRNVNHYIGYSLFNYSFKLVFDCGVVLHLKLGNPHFTGPVSHLAPCDVFTGCCKISERVY